MARFQRINLDGKSITETAVSDANLRSGEIVILKDGKFSAGATGDNQAFIVNTGWQEGLGADEAIPAGTSVIADYIEESREFAMRSGKAEYKRGDAVAIDGLKIKKAEEGDVAIGYSQEDVSLEDGDLLRVRIK